MKVSRPLTAMERAALERLLHEVGPRLLAYVRRAFNRLDAEDIVAETFARAADHVATLLKAERQDLYLLTTARNLCRDSLRRPARMTELTDSAAPATEDTESGVRSDRTEALRAAISELSAPLRDVVTLRLSAGLTFEEIGDMLEIPLGTALSRMNAAVRELKRRFECVRDGRD